MKYKSKRHRQGAEKVDAEKTYSLDEAVSVMQACPAPKFDEMVDVVVRLNVDPKKSDQLIRGAISLPKGIGKTKKVIVFAEGEMAEKAKAAGAVEVGAQELAKKIQDGWLDFDVAIATPAMMRVVGKLGKVLGPQGKMPSPKSGTVTPNVEKAVKEFVAGKIEFRVDPFGNIHAPVGKRSFAAEDLIENIQFLLKFVKTLRPSTVKGNYMEKASISSTMGPGIKIEVGE